MQVGKFRSSLTDNVISENFPLNAVARKSKYTPDIQDTICEAIATEGGDEVGWRAGGINAATFYRWLNRYSDFRDAVEQARRDFRERCPAYQKDLALEKLTDALENGQLIRWTTIKTRRLDHFYPGKDGQPDTLKWYQIETTEEEHIEHRPTPKWAIERVIPRPIEDDVNAAIAFLERQGFKVIVDNIEVINQWVDKN